MTTMRNLFKGNLRTHRFNQKHVVIRKVFDRFMISKFMELSVKTLEFS